MKKLHRLLLIMMTAFLLLVPAVAAFAAKKSSVIRPGESLQQVRTLSWKATLLRNVRTKYGRFRAGTVVTVVRGGAKCVIRLKGHNYSISRQYLSFGQDLASVVTKGDYNKLTKTTYINSTAHKSKSRYLVWVSLDKQRVNIFRGKNKKWKLVKVFKCTTGRENSTPIGNFTIKAKYPSYGNLAYYMEFSGSGFHRWPGVGVESIGTHTQSHGCIRMTQSNIIWMYNNLPVGTRVWIY